MDVLGRKDLQIHHVNYTLKRRGNGRFRVVSTWNTRGMFVGKRVMKFRIFAVLDS